MARVMLTGGPDFMEEISAVGVSRAMEVVGKATLFFTCRANQGAQFGLEKHVLAFPGAQQDNQRDRVLG